MAAALSRTHVNAKLIFSTVGRIGIPARKKGRLHGQRNARTSGVADPKHDESFKVVDRRLFTEEGELRKEAVEQERRDEEAAARKSSTAKSSAQEKRPTSVPTDGRLPQSAEPAETIAPSRNFQMLVDFLTRNAAAMMGGMADPRTGQAFLDLEGAREMIDMLDELRDKTRGNLAKADDDLLVEVLGSLKLTFMEVSKAATDAMAKKATQKK
ncbi:MAG TPA: DUF1844 domain-containing protein [Candidatus Acidoferrales bacterium]|nr:DUF1844 domain-containing protein [Candidatus Acidoferrales bacterium]